MDITNLDIDSLLEKKARSRSPDYDSKELTNKIAYKLGVAEAVIWQLILAFPHDKREEIIKDFL